MTSTTGWKAFRNTKQEAGKASKPMMGANVWELLWSLILPHSTLSINTASKHYILADNCITAASLSTILSFTLRHKFTVSVVWTKSSKRKGFLNSKSTLFLIIAKNDSMNGTGIRCTILNQAIFPGMAANSGWIKYLSVDWPNWSIKGTTNNFSWKRFHTHLSMSLHAHSWKA